MTATARWVSFDEVACDLTISQHIHAVLVSISNDGQTTSDQHLYIAHSPVCFECSVSENNVDQGTCTKKVRVWGNYFLCIF